MMKTIVIRTPEAIQARIREAGTRDFFGFETQDYLACLDFEDAREFLKPEVTTDQWPAVSSLEDVDKMAKEYLSFWLEKIENERGLSVVRATQHFMAWKWLLGHVDADTFPGSVNGGDGGWYQRDAYEYIKNQIESGEWDRLNEEAIQRAES